MARVKWPLEFLPRPLVFGMDEATHFKFSTCIDIGEYQRKHDKLPPKRHGHDQMTLFRKNGNNLETVIRSERSYNVRLTGNHHVHDLSNSAFFRWPRVIFWDISPFVDLLKCTIVYHCALLDNCYWWTICLLFVIGLLVYTFDVENLCMSTLLKIIWKNRKE